MGDEALRSVPMQAATTLSPDVVCLTYRIVELLKMRLIMASLCCLKFLLSWHGKNIILPIKYGAQAQRC